MRQWAIRVTYANGEDAWLRQGATIGEGAIVRFTSKQRAEEYRDFISQGLDADEVARVVRYRGTVQ